LKAKNIPSVKINEEKIMNKILLLIVLMFTSGTLVNAQSNRQIAVHVPFDFYVQNQKMPAGDYVIESASPRSAQSTLIFREKNGKSKKILMTIPIEINILRNPSDPTLLFNRYKNEYFLAEIRNPLENLGFALPKMKQEKIYSTKLGQPTRELVTMNLVKK
jgi:hypothetical protein